MRSPQPVCLPMKVSARRRTTSDILREPLMIRNLTSIAAPNL
jgi:hypothetical protein